LDSWNKLIIWSCNSDICVTLSTNSGEQVLIDCLQKVYPLGQFVLGGFAGSVKIGFTMLAKLQREFSAVDRSEAWILDIVANTWWPRLAKHIFNSFPKEEKKLGSQILLASAHPTKNRGDAPWAWTDVYSFSSPNFSPNKAGQNEIVSIGSGTDISTYINSVKEARDDFTYHQAMMLGGASAQGMFVASIVEKTVKENPISGVSYLFQVAIVKRGEFSIMNHEYDIMKPGGQKIEIRFPDIALNYDQLIQIIRNKGYMVEGALC
jgi:hypothetical protein